MVISARQPFFTRIYEKNYPQDKRARLYSMGVIVAALLVKFPVFGYVLISWFLLGFANLWTAPLRVVYLADPVRGLNLAPFTVLLINGIIPSITRLVTTRFWALIFDRFQFVYVRIALSIFLTVGILLFFLTDNIVIIAISSVLSWIGLAGATIISTLWVTRFAPVGMSQVFISIHFFLIGVRGIVGPPIGFYVASHLPLRTVGMISFFLGCISLLMLIPIIRKPLGSTSWRG